MSMHSQLSPDLDTLETLTTGLLTSYFFVRTRRRKEKLRQGLKQSVVALFGVMAATRILLWIGMPGFVAVLLPFALGLFAARLWVEQKDLQGGNPAQSPAAISGGISPSPS
jgi:hypothetical protein